MDTVRITAGHGRADHPMIYPKAGERPPRPPDPPPGKPAPAAAGMGATTTPPGGSRPGWPWDKRRLAILRHDARALNPIQFRPAAAATSNLGMQVRCHGLGITESQQPACTAAPGLIQIEYAFVNDLCEFVRQRRISPRSGRREIAPVIRP